MNITIIYPHKRKTKSSTYGIAQMVLDRLLSGGTLHEFYLPQDMPHVCAGCYACMNGREDKCGGHEYMQKLIAAIDDSELIVFCAPTYVYHIPGQVKTLLDHFGYRWLVHRPRPVADGASRRSSSRPQRAAAGNPPSGICATA